MSIQKRELSLEDIRFLATDQPNFTSTLSPRSKIFWEKFINQIDSIFSHSNCFCSAFLNFEPVLSQMQSRESSLSHATRAMWRFRQRRICRNILSTLKCRKRRRRERITWKAVGHVTSIPPKWSKSLATVKRWRRTKTTFASYWNYQKFAKMWFDRTTRSTFTRSTLKTPTMSTKKTQRRERGRSTYSETRTKSRVPLSTIAGTRTRPRNSQSPTQEILVTDLLKTKLDLTIFLNKNGSLSYLLKI